MMDSGVSDIPNNGITNAGLETSPETARKIFPPRTSSTLTQVDLDILQQAHLAGGWYAVVAVAAERQLRVGGNLTA